MRVLLFLLLSLSVFGAKPLEVYFIDVEGGQATLFVSPSGQSLLVDTGWPGYSNRDANRIAAAAKKAGIKKIDYVFITHFHTDHVGGAKQLADRIPVGTFIDKGGTVEKDKNAREMMEIYEAALATKASPNAPAPGHLVVKPGDKLPIKGIDVTVVAAGGAYIPAPANAAANSACASTAEKKPDTTDNGQSAGILLQYGSFRMIDLGDLTWDKEMELFCPANRIGPVSVYLTTHHGVDQSNSPAALAALHPKVAIMNNGARKGGSPSAWKIVHDSPGLEDLWQLHFAVAGGKETNVSDPFIANVDAADDGHYIELSAESNGSFTVTNTRNKYHRTYAK